METPSSLSTQVQADRKIFASLQSSASIEARISTAQHRVRITNSPSVLKADARAYDGAEHHNTTGLAGLLSSWFPPMTPSSDAYSHGLSHWLYQSSRLRWSLMVYCVFCLCILSLKLYSNFPVAPAASNSTALLPPTTARSPLQELPNPHLTFKLSSLYPPPSEFKPFVNRADSFDGLVTACLWSREEEIETLPSWASRWKDPMSVIVTTYHTPASPEALGLMAKLQGFRKLSSVKSKVSVHLLHLAVHTPENPNAFLNLARSFAQTDVVAMFPGKLSVVPPKTFYRSVASAVHVSKPVVFSTRQHTTYPWAALSPVLLGRDDALWCTERFFPPLSRSADWSECLWQVWLETLGDLEVKATTDWIQEPRQSLNATTAEIKVRRRLASKYRSETCVLATRQLAALRTHEGRVDTKKARWLKRHCREWTASGRE